MQFGKVVTLRGFLPVHLQRDILEMMLQDEHQKRNAAAVGGNRDEEAEAERPKDGADEVQLQAG